MTEDKREVPKHYYVLADAWELEETGQHQRAEVMVLQLIEDHPSCERTSRALFHFLWNQNKRQQALNEIRRFESATGSNAYSDVVAQVGEELHDDSA